MNIIAELFRAYANDDIETFCNILSSATHGTGSSSFTRRPLAGLGGGGSNNNNNNNNSGGVGGGPGASSSSNTTTPLKNKQTDVNTRDLLGRTILHIAASAGKLEYVRALVECPAVDVSLPDWESGWTALHLALYAGHIACAQTIIRIKGRETIKAKDKEGFSPFDVLNSTLRGTNPPAFDPAIGSSEIYTFGSNRNNNLGFGDGNDRAIPDRVRLTREAIIIMDNTNIKSDDRPFRDFMPMRVRDAQISRFHTAVITDQPAPNLYVCGFGSGGRLGTGDSDSQLVLTPVKALAESPVKSVALGVDHTIAVLENGKVYTWGSNKFGQLGYVIEDGKDSKKQDPEQLLPRLVSELSKVSQNISLVAASRVHSACATDSELYTWGTNNGQLGYLAAAEHQPIQITPRKVSSLVSPIKAMVAVDYATVCLLASNEVILFAGSGYAKVNFAFDHFSDISISSFFRPRSLYTPNSIVSLASGGSTIAAVSSMGGVYTFTVDESMQRNKRAALSKQIKPQRVWSLRRRHLAARSVAVGQDDSIMLCTEAGSVWMRGERVDKRSAAPIGSSRKFKFNRIPKLTRINAVRGSVTGSFIALRSDVTMNSEKLGPSTLADDICASLEWSNILSGGPEEGTKIPTFDQFLRAAEKTSPLNPLEPGSCDAVISTGENFEIQVPCHKLILQARCQKWTSIIAGRSDNISVETKDGKLHLEIRGTSITCILVFVYYLYSDRLVDTTSCNGVDARMIAEMRRKLFEIASTFGVARLVKHLKDGYYSQPQSSLGGDLFSLLSLNGTHDMTIELRDGRIKCHSLIMMARSQFFGAVSLFRPSGLGSHERTATENIVDLSHIPRNVFDIVLKDIYSDVDERVFANFKSNNLQSYLDFLIDVMAVANELLMTRLKSVCERALCVHLSMQNVTQILSEADMHSAENLKEVCFNYCSANIEGLLENRLLEDLDLNIVFDFEKHLQKMQGIRLPATKGGKLFEALLERNPDLEENHDISWVNPANSSLCLRAALNSLPSSHGSPAASFSFDAPISKGRGRSSKPSTPLANSPLLRPVESADKGLALNLFNGSGGNSTVEFQDEIFHMDDDYDDICRFSRRESRTQTPNSSETGNARQSLSSSLPKSSHDGWMDSRGKPISGPSSERRISRANAKEEPPVNSVSIGEKKPSKDEPRSAGSENRRVSHSLYESKSPYSPTLASYAPVASKKLSQKERKKLENAPVGDLPTSSPMASPWQNVQNKQTLKPLNFQQEPFLLSPSEHANQKRQVIRSKMADSSATPPQIHYSLLASSLANSSKANTNTNYDKNQPFGMIIAEQEEEKSARAAAFQVKSMEDIEREAQFESWWAAESKRVQTAEAESLRILKQSEFEAKEGAKKSRRRGVNGRNRYKQRDFVQKTAEASRINTV